MAPRNPVSNAAHPRTPVRPEMPKSPVDRGVEDRTIHVTHLGKGKNVIAFYRPADDRGAKALQVDKSFTLVNTGRSAVFMKKADLERYQKINPQARWVAHNGKMTAGEFQKYSEGIRKEREASAPSGVNVQKSAFNSQRLKEILGGGARQPQAAKPAPLSARKPEASTGWTEADRRAYVVHTGTKQNSVPLYRPTSPAAHHFFKSQPAKYIYVESDRGNGFVAWNQLEAFNGGKESKYPPTPDFK